MVRVAVAEMLQDLLAATGANAPAASEEATASQGSVPGQAVQAEAAALVMATVVLVVVVPSYIPAAAAVVRL